MKFAVRTIGELGDRVVLAPERHIAASGAGDGVRLGELVTLRGERILPDALLRAVVLDTTHARDGLVDVAGAMRDGAPAKSAKKRARVGDLIVSRLRPYLRQIAFVHAGVFASVGERALAVSSEYYVLTAREPNGDLAYLLPYFLGAHAQAALAAAQEGGHHPRVPTTSLLDLRVPRELVRRRRRTSLEVSTALAELYAASARLEEIFTRG